MREFTRRLPSSSTFCFLNIYQNLTFSIQKSLHNQLYHPHYQKGGIINFSEERKVFYSTEGISHKNFMVRIYKKKVKATQSCPTPYNPMDCSPPGSSVNGIPGRNTGVGFHALLQGIFTTETSSQTGGQTQVSHIVGRFFTVWVTQETQRIQSNVWNSIFVVSSVVYFMWLFVVIFFKWT